MVNFSARFATAQEIVDWDDHVTSNPNGGNMLQSASFAEVKSHFGWAPRFLVIEADGVQPSYNLALEKSVPGLGKYWYLIKGPDVGQPEHLLPAAEAVREFVRRERLGVFAVRVEPDVLASDDLAASLTGAGLVKVPDLQPNDHTAILDTTLDEQPLLRSLHTRGRNAVRRALREGAQAKRVEPTDENFRTMFELMNQVQDRNAMRLRSYEYYSMFWRAFVEAGQGRLYFAYEDGVPAVGAFVINYGKKGTYKDGGSIPRRKQYGDSHQLQWQAILDLKAEHGITEYDFCGTPPASELKNPEHPLYGLGLFKTSFTKTVVDFVGCYDVVVDRVRYGAWARLGEKVARNLWDRKHHQPFY
ncbi:lipid II:glycine glycyltransferase FemX [Falsarthrobacter nasiphocae]|uniref:Lipid II:glycine glycyltransferase (Peptidoglycan interpeptide bridge formation enzyme) n=1 Tax=Falsarthrobacter nasiphocae TaxID=189863 RepID=A0AAE3YGZ6_9MICC|nr:peptidoglycan bridge formation glycyltransferase FemA/FemB family protein [Falsarthrobacter nasiphocae]MDR6891748.1 lipid II:glycine glycyltransferase (peptidoglycan interpeptide bridge formation enzyme) [Falsarthrobacter nasiphocae]